MINLVIKTKKGEEILVSELDYPLLSLHKWYVDKKGYAYMNIGAKQIKMHRLVCNPGKGLVVDHINRNKLDNRRENLRSVYSSQNAQNVEMRFGRSKYIGVRYREKQGMYEVYANFKGKEVYIGKTSDEIEAAEMRDAFVYRTRGDFAFLNFPENSDKYEEYIFKNVKVYKYFEL